MFGDRVLACPRSELLARRANIVERAWVKVTCEAVGADGQVVPQRQWLSKYHSSQRPEQQTYRGAALCCNASAAADPNGPSHEGACCGLPSGGQLLALGCEKPGRSNEAVVGCFGRCGARGTREPAARLVSAHRRKPDGPAAVAKGIVCINRIANQFQQNLQPSTRAELLQTHQNLPQNSLTVSVWGIKCFCKLA